MSQMSHVHVLGHSKKVTSVVAHPSEKFIVSASPDCLLKIWDIDGENCKHSLKIHDNAITGFVSVWVSGWMYVCVCLGG